MTNGLARGNYPYAAQSLMRPENYPSRQIGVFITAADVTQPKDPEPLILRALMFHILKPAPCPTYTSVSSSPIQPESELNPPSQPEMGPE